MNQKKSNMSLEYRVGMIIAYSCMLLSVFLPMFSYVDRSDSLTFSLFMLFSRRRIQALSLVTGDISVAAVTFARSLVILYMLFAIAGILCYALQISSRVKEGVFITLVIAPCNFWMNVSVVLIMLRVGSSMVSSYVSDGASGMALGLAAPLAALACIYAFFRPLVYLCTYKANGSAAVVSSASAGSSYGAKGQLRGISGTYAGQIIPLKDGEKIVLGRSAEDSNLIVDSPKVSRRHCEITFDKKNGTFILRDYSYNGTYKISGEKFEKHEILRPGTKFYLGNKDNIFQVE